MKKNKKCANGGIMKNYSFGGDISRFALNNLEQATLGTLGVDIYKPKFDSDTFQQVNDVTQKINGGLQDVGAGIANKFVPGISAVRQVGKQISQFPKGGLMKNYQQGGQMPKNILPQNPNDLQAVTENTMEYRGNSHKSGGIPLNNGAELEKDETVIKQGAIGNQNPYAISPNLVLDRETAKLVGLSSKYAGMKLSDISRKIEDMKAAKENDAMSEKTNSMNKKFALNRLIKANELLSAQHRQEQGVNEMSDLRQEEMAQMQLGGTMITKDGRIIQRKPFQGEVVEEDILTSPEQDGFYGNYNQQTTESNPLKIGRNMPSLQKNFSLINTDMSQLNMKGLDAGRENLMRYNNLGKLEGNNVGTSVLNNSTNLNVPNLTVPQVDFPNDKSSFDLKSNLGNIGMGLKGASLLANFATIGKKPGQIPAQFNPYATDILNNYHNTIDNQAIENDVTSVLNTGLNSNPSRNWNVQRAMNSDLVGKSMEAMSKANLQNQELNNRYRSELGNVQNNLGQQNVQAKNMAEVLNAQTQANWRNNLRSAIGNVGNDAVDMLIQKQFVQDATKDGVALTKEKVKLLQQKWGNTFGQDANKFKEMLRVAYPSITDAELTKMINE